MRDVDIHYVNSPTGELVAEITPDMLRQWGVNVDMYPKLASYGARTPLDKPLGDFIPFASSALDFSKMTLNLSIPQAGLVSNAEDYIDPSRWNDGVPVMFSDYAFSGTRHNDDAQNTTTSQYLNLRSGANLGGWRLRNY
jgi:outer membrane usher protein